MENVIAILNEKFYEKTYSDETYVSLCDEFEIPVQIRLDFRNRLEDVAAILRWRQSQAEHIRRPSDDAKELKNVSKHAQKLREALEALSSSALIGLDRTNSRFGELGIISDQKYSDAGHEFYQYTNQDGNEVILTDDVDDLVRAVSILEYITNETTNDIPSISAGSRSDYALMLWISNIADMWTNQLEKPFTRDATKEGEPLTEAARFCVALFAHVSPSTTSTKILNGMKKHISETRKKATGKVRFQNKT